MITKERDGSVAQATGPMDAAPSPKGTQVSAEESTSTTPDVPWLTEPEQRAWRAWLRGYRLLMVALEEGLAGTGVRMGEYEVLSMLSEATEGRMRMSALADMVVQSRSRLTHTAKRLEALGLVRRERISGDGRGVEVSVTPEGFALVERVAPVHLVTVREQFLDQMSGKELLGMGDVMRRVIVAARERPEQGSDAF